MAPAEQKSENAAAFIVIGLGLLLAALLIIFFAPAAFKVGHQGAFITLIAALGVIGCGLILRGRRARKSTM